MIQTLSLIAAVYGSTRLVQVVVEAVAALGHKDSSRPASWTAGLRAVSGLASVVFVAVTLYLFFGARH